MSQTLLIESLFKDWGKAFKCVLQFSCIDFTPDKRPTHPAGIHRYQFTNLDQKFPKPTDKTSIPGRYTIQKLLVGLLHNFTASYSTHGVKVERSKSEKVRGHHMSAILQ